MAIFITGATGYIGGSIAARLSGMGREVRGLVRTEEKAKQLATLGITPVVGNLDDSELLRREARSSEGVINAADSDHRAAVQAIIEGLAGSGKPFLHTSGTEMVAENTGGDVSGLILDDERPFALGSNLDDRASIDQLVMDAPQGGLCALVLCNTCIYGRGAGLHEESIMVPWLIRQARKDGAARYIGKGESIWSTVHIDDLVDLYVSAWEMPTATGFYFVENGEASFAQIAQAIASRLALGEPQSWSGDQATAACGPIYAYIFGSNCRVRGRLERTELHWKPKRPSLIQWITREA